MSETLLEVRDLKKYFPVTAGVVFERTVGWVKAVDGVSFTLGAGETLGLVGESGCGKTTTARLVLRLDRPTEGAIVFEGQDLQALGEQDLKRYRRKVQAVFQDPYSSFNPRMRIGDFIAEPLVVNRALPAARMKERVAELLGLVGLGPDAARLFPHEFSGGMRQRIAIARALALNPALIVLDEPVSALDVSIRAQIMNLLQDLQQTFGLSYLLIAHDLAAVLHLSTTIAVMYLGKIVERTTSDMLRRRPLHPYTQALFAAALPAHPDDRRDRAVISGEIANPIDPPSGCPFHPRCPSATPVCAAVEPVLHALDASHEAACHLYGDQ
jgi:oligopeptide/dipeptide ABC transporter ATP-binding protein